MNQNCLKIDRLTCESKHSVEFRQKNFCPKCKKVKEYEINPFYNMCKDCIIALRQHVRIQGKQKYKS